MHFSVDYKIDEKVDTPENKTLDKYLSLRLFAINFLNLMRSDSDPDPDAQKCCSSSDPLSIDYK
jgi:hypothetical protein